MHNLRGLVDPSPDTNENFYGKSGPISALKRGSMRVIGLEMGKEALFQNFFKIRYVFQSQNQELSKKTLRIENGRVNGYSA